MQRDSIPLRLCVTNERVFTRVDPVLLMWKIERRFVDAEQTLNIIRGADLAIWPGQSVALIAPSGTGKSTLLHMAGLLEKPDAGEIYIGGTATSTLDDKARTTIRRETLGFVYQAHHLLPEFTALENVMLPQMIGGLDRGRRGCVRRTSYVISDLASVSRIGHRNCQAVNNNAWRSRVRWLIVRVCFLPMSRQVILIRRHRNVCSSHCFRW